MAKSKYSSYKKEPKAVAVTQVALHQEPVHNDDDVITASNFPFGELIPNWSNFDPNTKNPAIGSTFASGHHGGSGGKKLSDFKKFELACCLEFIDKAIAGVNDRVRCMNVFTVHSNQCTTHGKTTHKDGPNKIYTLMKRNEEGNWGMIKDTHVAQQNRKPADWQLTQQLREKAAARLDEAAANGEDVDTVWAVENAVIEDKSRIAKKRVSASAHGKTDLVVDADDDVDSAAGMKAAFEVKRKGIVSGKKGTKAAWKKSRLGPIREA